MDRNVSRLASGCSKVSGSPGVRLVTVNSGKIKLTRTRVWFWMVTVVAPVAGKTVPLTIMEGSQLSVIGSFSQPLAIAERVKVYGVAVRRSARFVGL
jgi:hypothetical protein